ncbi:unnamed protein product [Rotaria sp. Silwood1]|nr:unnamed protein product [Rotaria sp. Silwood1]
MSAMVTAVVGKGQHKLKQPFEYNKKMLKLDSTDHRFVQYVYDLKPNKQQIRSIRNIWKAIYNKKASDRKKSSTNDDDNKQKTILYACRLKKIGRFKYGMLELSIAAGKEKVRY